MVQLTSAMLHREKPNHVLIMDHEQFAKNRVKLHSVDRASVVQRQSLQ